MDKLGVKVGRFLVSHRCNYENIELFFGYLDGDFDPKWHYIDRENRLFTCKVSVINKVDSLRISGVSELSGKHFCMPKVMNNRVVYKASKRLFLNE